MRLQMIGVCAVVLCAIFFAYSVYAQEGPGDYGYRHDENFGWYKNLKQPNGGSCCTTDTDHDCRETKAHKDGNVWRVLIDGKWYSVPPDRVLPSELNENPFTATVCAGRSDPPFIYCFLAPRAGG